jgi:predicted alpha/beta-fold hydrolase
MQRPVMDLQYMREVEEAARVKPSIDWCRYLRPVGRAGLVTGSFVFKLLLTSFRRSKQNHPAWALVARGVAYRLMFVPILVTLITSAMVYRATHQRSDAVPLDPVSVGVYYDPVTVVAADGVRSDAWLAPALDARKVVADREKALRSRSPGVVLVHDMGESHRQMLPLVRPLHEAGYVVLVVGTRGSGTPAAVGQTFGLNEAMDVRAAVDMLRRRPYVDPQRMAVIGVGAGATAAVLAREQDPTITGLVLIDLPDDPANPVKQKLGFQTRALRWVSPLCRWTFEVAYQVNLSDLDVGQILDKLDPNATLRLENVLKEGLATKPAAAQPVTDFLKLLFRKQVVARSY